MKKRTSILLPILLMLALTQGFLSGCTTPDNTKQDTAGQEDASQEETSADQTPTLAAVRIGWNGYTMGIDLVTDDPEKTKIPEKPKTTKENPDSKRIKVCFYYLSGGDGSNAFAADSLLQSLNEHPIVLKDSIGTMYTYTHSISDIAFKPINPGTDPAYPLEEHQPRFSITFEVPTDSHLEDFTLDAGDGQNIALIPYTSDAYNTAYPPKDNK